MNIQAAKDCTNRNIKLYKTYNVLDIIQGCGAIISGGIITYESALMLQNNFESPIITGLSTIVITGTTLAITHKLVSPMKTTNEKIRMLKLIRQDLDNGINNFENVKQMDFEREFQKIIKK